MQIILGICCLCESFLLSWAVLAAQVWPRALASVLLCPEPLLSKHLWGSCGSQPLFSREQNMAQAPAAPPQSWAGGSAQQTHPCQREQPPWLHVRRSWRGSGKLLDPQAVEGLPLLPLKSITPFPLGSLGTGPSAWLVVKAHIIAAFMEAWSLIGREGVFPSRFLHGTTHCFICVCWTAGGWVRGLIVAWPSRQRAGSLITWLRAFPPLWGADADCNQRGHRLLNRLITRLGGSLWKKADPQSVPLLICHWGSLQSPGIENTWEQSVSEKYSRKTAVLFLFGQPGWAWQWTRDLDQPSTSFTGFTLSVRLLRFAHHETYCKRNSWKLSEMVLQVCQNSQTILFLNTYIAVWALEQPSKSNATGYPNP